MPKAFARIETDNARKYLAQLCKHFAHKLEVELTEDKGIFHFTTGHAVIEADDAALTMSIEAEDAEKVTQVEGIIDAHLLRFAFREKLDSITWRAA